MKWDKGNGQIMDAQDNEATEKYLTSLGFTKVGSDPVEVGEPDTIEETETVEISEADIPENLPMSDPTPDTPGEPPEEPEAA